MGGASIINTAETRARTMLVCLLAWWAGACVCLAQDKVTTNSRMLGIGGVEFLDTYLSQEKYSGTELRYISHTLREREGKRLSRIIVHQGSVANARNRADNCSEMAGTYKFSYGLLYGWKLLGGTLTGNGKGVGQEIFSRGTSEILGCARAMKKGRMLGLIADQDGGYDGIFVPFLGKMASTPNGPAYFARKFKAPIIPIFIVRKPDGYGHTAIVNDPIHYEFTGDTKLDDYNVTLKMTQEVEKIIKQYPDNWLWFQHRWNTPYTPPEEEKQADEK